MMIAMSLSGCASPDEPPDPPCWTEPSEGALSGEVELGLGGDSFYPVAENDPIELHAGVQGGHHFILRTRTKDVLSGEDGSTETMFAVLTEEGESIDSLLCPYRVPYEVASGANNFLVLRDSVFLIIDEDYVAMIDGRPLLFQVEVIDAEGRYARDERWLTVEYTPEESEADGGVGAMGLTAE